MIFNLYRALQVARREIRDFRGAAEHRREALRTTARKDRHFTTHGTIRHPANNRPLVRLVAADDYS